MFYDNKTLSKRQYILYHIQSDELKATKVCIYSNIPISKGRTVGHKDTWEIALRTIKKSLYPLARILEKKNIGTAGRCWNYLKLALKADFTVAPDLPLNFR